MNRYNSYLAHHGVLGQKWGIRKRDKIRCSDRRARHKIDLGHKVVKALLAGAVGLALAHGSGSNSLDEARERAKIKGPKLSKKEYAHVMSEIATHASDDQRSRPTFAKNIGKYRYIVLNNMDGTYEILHRSKI